MKLNVDSIVAIARGFDEAREELERRRIEKIRRSNIVDEVTAFDGPYRSAKYLGVKKPVTGLVELAAILRKMKG